MTVMANTIRDSNYHWVNNLAPDNWVAISMPLRKLNQVGVADVVVVKGT